MCRLDILKIYNCWFTSIPSLFLKLLNLLSKTLCLAYSLIQGFSNHPELLGSVVEMLSLAMEISLEPGPSKTFLNGIDMVWFSPELSVSAIRFGFGLGWTL